jgi:hypothetical protein
MLASVANRPVAGSKSDRQIHELTISQTPTQLGFGKFSEDQRNPRHGIGAGFAITLP